MSGAILFHNIPARLVLPVIMAAPDGDMIFGPDNLRPRLKAARSKTQQHCGRVERSMPHVCDIALKQPPRLAPVCSVVVRDSTDSATASPHLALTIGVEASALITPIRIIFDPVRWICH